MKHFVLCQLLLSASTNTAPVPASSPLDSTVCLHPIPLVGGYVGKNDRDLAGRIDLSYATSDPRFIANLCAAIRVPCGIELLPGKLRSSSKSQRDASLLLNNVSARNILDQIVNKAPEYSWSFVGGVVNFYPKDNSVFRSPLDRRVGPVDLRFSTTENPVLKLCLDLGIFCGEDSGSVSGLRQSKSPGGAEIAIKRKIGRGPIRAVLNEIVRRDVSAIWSFSDCVECSLQENKEVQVLRYRRW